MTAGLAALDPSVGGLEEAAIATEDLLFGIACELAEGRGRVDDGLVVSAGVDDDKGTGHVDGAEVDLGVRTTGDAAEEGEKVKAGGGVDGEAEGGGDGDGERRWVGIRAACCGDGGLEEARGRKGVEWGRRLVRYDGLGVVGRLLV